MTQSGFDGDLAANVLWGKSNAGGQPNLLVQHLFDTAAVGELIWDRYLAQTVRRSWDDATLGAGRQLFTLLCGLHDLGKATPAFQSKAPDLAEAVQRAGLTWPSLKRDEQGWHHTLAGARIVRELLPAHLLSRKTVDWIWPFVAGHHGKVPSLMRLQPPGRGACHGLGREWRDAQAALFTSICGELRIDLAALAQARPPARAVQLSLLGALVMADWVASNDKHFPGIAPGQMAGVGLARERALAGWQALGLRGGWCSEALPVHSDPVHARFAVRARAGQVIVVSAAQRIPAPGLLIVEAPMGEGKTEAALAAAEVLCRRFGADGVFVGMPTQATSDPMFRRVRLWAESVDPDVPVALLHGKARFNRDWHDLMTKGEVRIAGVDEFGCEDTFGLTSDPSPTSSGQAPAEWFVGRKRGLLTPVVVGTVDQLLHAATRTRHVMLRHAGLAGKVVVLDEVHAYDVYMSQFLHEALRWLAEAGVPVLVLSATLPPSTHAELARSYLQGAHQARDVDVTDMPSPSGYPACTSVAVHEGVTWLRSEAAASWRSPIQVAVQLSEEPARGGPERVTRLLQERLADGGCALVIRNTVARAQETYLAAREVFGEDAVLLHSRLTVGERADRTERVLDMLGPQNRSGGRPRRLVVVATQLAEQSFDVDVDLLVTDLAPIDLLLQRIGRLHRHDRPDSSRPTAVREPQVVVTGVRRDQAGPPSFPLGSRHVYGQHVLLRAAHLVFEAVDSQRPWAVPTDVPDLVRRGYAEELALPQEWESAADSARSAWLTAEADRCGRAEQFLLSGADALGTPTLAGLHERHIAELDDEDAVAAVVRDGEPSIEVVLVQRDERGYVALDGRRLGPTGEAVSDGDVLERVVRDTVRLRPDLTDAAVASLAPLPGWSLDPWLAHTRALILDPEMSASLGGWQVRYDRDLGLSSTRASQ